MNREETIEVSKQLYGITAYNTSNLMQLMNDFLLEKGKEKDKIDLFVRGISSIPLQITLDYYSTALKYFIDKYTIYTLIHKDKVILIY